MPPAHEASPEPPADWEVFYSDYRKPGYVEGFEITSKLGGGMFGLVFRARRMSIGKDYAIKFLKVDDGEVRKAVLSELEQVKYFAQIDHPNLVSIEDRGEVDGIPYLVMAFAGTETLRDKLPDRPPTAEEKDMLLRAFLQSCRGLQALHERSLVHFDIKPANVFLKGGVARLGDYGLSKLVTHSRGSLSMGRGTPYYMAPEMLQRRGDARSDIYSLGVMLYEILCGKVPFTGDSEWEVLKKHETAQPELPAHLTPVERAVLRRCLAKDPADRFQGVHDLIVAFGAAATPGAASWHDLRDGATIGAERPAGRAASPPKAPPLPDRNQVDPSSHDAYTAVAQASKEVWKHASVAARHAVRDAHRVARDAARKARAKWHESVGRSRIYGLRRWRALRRLDKQKLGRQAREQAQRVADGIANAFKPRSWLWRAFWISAALLLTLMVVGAFFFLMLTPRMATGSELGVAIGRAPEPIRSTQSTFHTFIVPPALQQLVSTSEPAWAARSNHDQREAKRLLLQHIEKLRRNAPIEPDVRRSLTALPTFQVGLAAIAATHAREDVDELLRSSSYDRKLARRIVANGPLALAVAGQVMAQLSWSDPGDLERARRLQRLLVEATGCRDLQLVEGEHSPAELAAYNQPLGSLWVWFVNEFGHTERAWAAYRKLLRL